MRIKKPNAKRHHPNLRCKAWRKESSYMRITGVIPLNTDGDVFMPGCFHSDGKPDAFKALAHMLFGSEKFHEQFGIPDPGPDQNPSL
jgi:hypothetical protein